MLFIKDVDVGFDFANEDIKHSNPGADSLIADEANMAQACLATVPEGEGPR